MGAATSMPIILIMNPALVESLAEDHLVRFVQHQQLGVVFPDRDVELLLGVDVVAFPQGVVLGPGLLRHLLKHWSMCVCVCASCKVVGSCANPCRAKGSGNQHLDTGPAMVLHGILVAIPVPPFLASAR